MTTNWIHNKHIPLWCILLLTVVVFSPTFGNGFQMGWDDQWMVMNGFTVQNINYNYIKELFCTPFNGQWGPLNQLMYTCIYSLFKYNPCAFHTASLILHLVNITIVYYGLSKILTDCTNWSKERIFYTSTFVTLFFGIHPLQVETVAWISASKILMCSTFYLLATLSLIQYLHSSRLRWYLATILLFIMSYLSKEQAVTYPLFATVLCLWYKIKPTNSRFWFILIPLYLIASIQCAHEIFIVANYNLYIKGDTFVWWERIILMFYSFATYVFNWIIPNKLNWMYAFPIEPKGDIPLWLTLYPVLLVVVFSTCWTWLKKKHVLSALAFVLIHLLLVLHITVLPRAAVIADRYMYLSIIGLNFLLAYFIFNETSLGKHKKTIIIFVIGITLLYGGLSFIRVFDWDNSENLRASIENIMMYYKYFYC